jgi:hypothetical protein
LTAATEGWRTGTATGRRSSEALDLVVAIGHDVGMRKAMLVAAVVAGLVVVARRLAPKMQNLDWEQRFERMPDNAPPKWMFNNIRAIRENTDRILEALERERGDASPPGGTAS